MYVCLCVCACMHVCLCGCVRACMLTPLISVLKILIVNKLFCEICLKECSWNAVIKYVFIVLPDLFLIQSKLASAPPKPPQKNNNNNNNKTKIHTHTHCLTHENHQSLSADQNNPVQKNLTIGACQVSELLSEQDLSDSKNIHYWVYPFILVFLTLSFCQGYNDVSQC